MFSEEIIRQTVDSIRVLWTDYEKLANSYRDFSLKGRGNGHPNTVLKSPEEFEKLLRMSREEAVNNVFGMGGNGYVSLAQQVERFRWRLCVEFYQHMQANIPAEVVEYIERLCQMDAEDAVYYAKQYETAQWDLYSQPAAQPVKKKANTGKIGTALFVIGWILFVFYMFQFGRMLIFSGGWMYSAPAQFLLLGSLIVFLLALAKAMRTKDGGGEVIVFLVLAAIIFGIVFCGSVYNPGGFFQVVFWKKCLPILIQFIVFLIIGNVIGTVIWKKNNGK